MLKSIRSIRPGTPLVAVLVLVLALAGTATAAKLITGKQVKNASLTGADLKDGSVKPADLSAATKTELKGEPGEKGDKGEKGEPGAAGTPGAAGAPGAAGPGTGFMGRMDTLATAVVQTQFGYVDAPGTAVSQEEPRLTLTPDTALKTTKLTVQLTAAPGAGAQRTFTLRVNGANTALSCTIAEAATSCTSAEAVTIPASATATMRTQVGLAQAAAADAIYTVTVDRP